MERLDHVNDARGHTLGKNIIWSKFQTWQVDHRQLLSETQREHDRMDAEHGQRQCCDQKQ
jgi:hypothetical protein